MKDSRCDDEGKYVVDLYGNTFGIGKGKDQECRQSFCIGDGQSLRWIKGGVGLDTMIGTACGYSNCGNWN